MPGPTNPTFAGSELHVSSKSREKAARTAQAVVRDVAHLRWLYRVRVGARIGSTFRWFGGSAVLQDLFGRSVTWELLVRLRRILDKAGGNEHNLWNAIRLAAVDLEGDHDEEVRLNEMWNDLERIRSDARVEHLQRLTNKTIAHADPEALSRLASKVAGVSTDEFREEQIIWAIERVTELAARLDPTVSVWFDCYACNLAKDGFSRRLQQTGLPGLQFASLEVFAERGGNEAVVYGAIEASVWERVVALLPRPLPRDVAAADARVWRSMVAVGQRSVLDVRTAADRWGMRIEDALEVWRSPASWP
jgi:hypothetical protein